MASHLSVITTTPSGTLAAKDLSASAGGGSETTGIGNIFAALLGTVTPTVANLPSATPAATEGTPTRTSELTFESNVGNLLDLFLGTEQEKDAPDDPDPLAAVLDVQPTPAPVPVATTPVQTLADIVDSLASVQADFDAGRPVEPEQLAKIVQTIDSLADQLGLSLDETPTIDALKAQLANEADAASPLLQSLLPLLETTSDPLAVPADADPTVAPQLAKLGEKLAALLGALQTADIPPDLDAQLGLATDAAPDPELAAALDRLNSVLGKTEAAPSQPVLATPQLTLTEPVLTGKSDTPGTPPDPAVAATADAATTPTTKPDLAQDNAAPRDDKDKPAKDRDAAAATPTSAPSLHRADDPALATQTQHQASRIDVAAAPRPLATGYQTSQQQLNLPQLAFELVRQANEGNSRFQIRLDPPELGKIEVKLDFDATGQVNAKLTVEKAETLDLMQRDQRGLERALQQAGLDTAKTNLEFSLKQNPFAGMNDNGQGRQGQSGGQPRFSAQSEDAVDTPPVVTLYRGSLSATGVNIIA